MATLSVPLTPELERYIAEEISLGNSDNKAQVVRKALRLAAREAAYQRILAAEKEPSLRGNLRYLLKSTRSHA